MANKKTIRREITALISKAEETGIEIRIIAMSRKKAYGLLEEMKELLKGINEVNHFKFIEKILGVLIIIKE